MQKLSSFVQSVLGGAVVGIGGIVFLAVDNRIVGSFLFTVGLFCICTFGFQLYTGKVCYCCDNKPPYIAFVCGVWAGNLVGAAGVGLLIRLTRMASVAEKAAVLAEVKLGDTLLSTFILAVFCNIMIYIAAESYANNPHEVGKYLGIVFGVMVFILAGFEHCVANMFYFTVAGAWGGETIVYLLVATLGNALGGMLFPLAKKLKSRAAGTKASL